MNSELFEKILEAIKESDDEMCENLVRQLDPDAKTIEQTNEFLENIRKCRSFEILEKIAAIFSVAQPNNITAKRQLAQALIEQKKLVAAKRVLQRLKDTTIDNSIEESEVTGLLGRTYKQIYVDSSDVDSLKKAIRFYKEGWSVKQGDYRWHGINYIALLNHAKKYTGLTDLDDFDPIAREILSEISNIEETELQPWDSGTAFESCIALEDWGAAESWLQQYVSHEKVDAFALAGTLRQLREIWNLGDIQDGEKLLPPLEAALLDKNGGSLELREEDADNPIDSKTFQAIFGKEGPRLMEWFETMQLRAKAVARVIKTNTDEPVGTGFLIQGEMIENIDERFKSKLLFITNSHVISNEEIDIDPLNHRPQPLKSLDASAEFTFPGPPIKKNFREVVKYSPVSDKDYIILSFEENNIETDPEPLVPHLHLPILSNNAVHAQRIFVVGHAEGKALSVSLYDNELVDIELPFIHYESPTEGGSSGSPLLNNDWQLIGLHHASLNDRKVNEGIAISEII